MKATYVNESETQEISPITQSTTFDHLKRPMKHFLSKILTIEKMHSGTVVLDEMVTGQGGIYQLTTFDDGSQWCVANRQDGMNRIVGAWYLDRELKQLELNNQWAVVETKYRLVGGTRDKLTFKIVKASYQNLQDVYVVKCDGIRTLSKYVGEDRPESSTLPKSFKEDMEKIEAVTGYFDFYGCANLRSQQDGTTIILDTDYSSFSKNDAESLSTLVKDFAGAEFAFTISEIFAVGLCNARADHSE